MSIKQGNNYIAGGGSGVSVSIDNLSITRNSSLQIQTVGVIDSNNTSNAIKTWTGTKAQYEAIASKDANTLYNIIDDTSPVDIMQTILSSVYPVGSVYITTANTCPLSALISGSTWELVSSGIVKSGEVPVRGNGNALGLTGGSGYTDSYLSTHIISNNSTRYFLCNTSSSNPVTGSTPSTETDGSTASGSPRLLGVNTDSSKSGMVLDTTSFTLSVNIFERTV